MATEPMQTGKKCSFPKPRDFTSYKMIHYHPCGEPAVVRYENLHSGETRWRCVEHDKETAPTMDKTIWGRQVLT